jgi:hypothetical protein
MFYLDCILYITLIFLAWILIDKIINEEEGVKLKEGFKHKGKAVIADNKKSMDISLLNPNIKGFNVFETAKLGYNFLSIFANVFVKYPNQYVMKLGSMAQGPIESVINKFKVIIKDSQERGKELMEELKPYLTRVIPFSITDLTKMIGNLMDKVFDSLGDFLKPKNPNS